MGHAAEALPEVQTQAPRHSDASKALSLGERAATVRSPCFWPALPGKRPLSQIERAGLLRLSDSIPGACSDEETVALIEAMRHAPTGDVVEIGSGCGRTAVLLAWLARRYQIGAVLCVDAWSEEAATDFEIAVAPLADGRLNRLQTSEASGYGPGFRIATKTFGETCYEGQLALLHASCADCVEPWIGRMAPGGWIVTSGEGDVLGDARRERVSASFVAGGSRFVQLKR